MSQSDPGPRAHPAPQSEDQVPEAAPAESSDGSVRSPFTEFSTAPEQQGLYRVEEESVELQESTLFDTSISMPANISEGRYLTRVFLTRAGKVVSVHESEIQVGKVGLERWLFTLSRQMPLVYGLLSLAIAALAGWGASALFRAIRSG